jgi:hypothetical protein
MAFIKRIVCLANSFKKGGSCVAGREILEDGGYGAWIRPVSSRPTAEISSRESTYESLRQPKLLDILEISLLRKVPHNHQTENFEIDGKRWKKVGELPLLELDKLLEYPESLWINSDNTNYGAFNCISELDASTLKSSLVLIKPENFAIEIKSTTWDGKTKKNYFGSFDYKRVHYSLKVTDPIITNRFESKEDGKYPSGDVFLCVSLTEPYEMDHNRCHKLIAAVIANGPM